MQSKIQLSHDELVALVKAVFEYNRRSPTSVQFIGPDGGPVVVDHVEVVCDESGLTVRVEPEDCGSMSPEDTVAKYSSMVFSDGP